MTDSRARTQCLAAIRPPGTMWLACADPGADAIGPGEGHLSLSCRERHLP